MAKPYIPLAIWNYTPVLHSMPALEINSATEAPLVCVQMSQHLVPYILGLLELYRWPDKFKGTPEAVERSLGIIQDLLVILTEGNCPDCPEENMPASWRFTVDCGLEYSYDNGDTWTPVPGWSTFAEDCFKGEDGAEGAVGSVGPPGADGADGADCDCGDPTPTQPPIEPEPEDRCQVACNIAMGMGRWLWGAHNDSLVFAKQAFEAGAIILDAVSDYIDLFPVFGAFVNATVDALTHWASADLGALIAVNDNAFREEMQCKLYEIMADDTDDFTADYLFQVREELQDWAALLPPRGPFVAFIGQSLAIFLEQVQGGELLRRANIYKASGDNCDLCGVECGGECSAAMNMNFVQNPVVDNFGFSLMSGVSTEWGCGDAGFGTAPFAGSRTTAGWVVGSNANPGLAIGIKKTFDEPYRLCTAEILANNSTGQSNTRLSTLFVLETGAGDYTPLVCQRYGINVAGSPGMEWEGDKEITEMIIVMRVGAGNVTITKVELNAV